jgi:hypothetical protein
MSSPIYRPWYFSLAINGRAAWHWPHHIFSDRFYAIIFAMKNLPLLLLTVGVLAPLARADEASSESEKLTSTSQFLSWEHTLTTRTAKSKNAVARLKIYNNWTPDRHRLLVKYNVLGLGAQHNWVSEKIGPAFSMPDFDASRIASRASYHYGALGIVTRHDDDRLIAYSSEAGDHGEYFSEKKSALLKRLRFDPWKKLAPELSKTDPPSLTLEQRRRLGGEVRAVLRPILKDVFKAYFRAVPQPRRFNVSGEAIEARGYRLSVLINSGDRYDGAQWMRANFEWWLAPSTPGDDAARAFGAKSFVAMRQLHGPTTSMWINEMLPVMWQLMPAELHQAVATLMPTGLPSVANPSASPGAPVYAAMTLSPAKGQEKFDDTGTIRVELQMVKREMRALDAKIFEAPPEYEKESLEPILKGYEEGIGMMQSVFDEEMRLSDTRGLPTAKPKYSWNALREYLRTAQTLTR